MRLADSLTMAPVDSKSERLADQMRGALRSCVTGVTVVTTVNGKGNLAGMTANSFTSVSLDPPLVLVCLSMKSRSFGEIEKAGRFTVNVLAEDQSDVARGFAAPGGNRGAICAWRINERGFAVLDRHVLALECRIWRQDQAGDHAIIIGEVGRVHAGKGRPLPLVWHAGRLHGLSKPNGQSP
jgi:flavin reductase (DIM6/NTAB) family NADH-FMN oxidoreductase RutF